MNGRKFSIRTAILASCIVLAGCASTYRNHGYAPADEDLDQIQVGVDTRVTVRDLVGAPSTSGVLNDSGFYYVSSRVRHFAYREPEVVERQIVAVSFDAGGRVSNIERFALEDGQVVPLSRRVTSSSIQNSGFLRQLLGNLGRFSASDFVE